MKSTSAFATAFSLVASLAQAQGFAPAVAPIYDGLGRLQEFTVCNRPSWDDRVWCGKYDAQLDRGYGTWHRAGIQTWGDSGVSMITTGPIQRGVSCQPHWLSTFDSSFSVAQTFCASGPGIDNIFGWFDEGTMEGPGVQGTPALITMWFTPGLRADRFFEFGRAGDDSIVYHDLNDNTWFNIGGQTFRSPAAVSSQSGKMDVFIVDAATATARTRTYVDGAGWPQPWVDLGGFVNAAPAATSHDGSHVAVYVRSGDNFLYAKDRIGATGWGPQWYRVGPNFTITSDIGAYADPDTNKTYIFVRGTDNAIWVYDTFGNNTWVSMGGDFS
jgi:hypothetical protein